MWIGLQEDPRARSPGLYRAPLYHLPNFLAILDMVKLSAGDNVLEVGCGAGAFIKEALTRGCIATGVDHSPEQLSGAEELNNVQLESGRLNLVEAGASDLPLKESVFTAAVMTGVFGFLEYPVEAFLEIRRWLVNGGRMVAFVSSPELRGTPASPEPFASRMHFCSMEEVIGLARSAGFEEVEVLSFDFNSYATRAGLSYEEIAPF